MTYPNGRNLNYDYGTAGGMNDAASRVGSLIDNDGATHLADYSYLGLTAVVVANEAAAVAAVHAGGDGGRQRPRHGRHLPGPGPLRPGQGPALVQHGHRARRRSASSMATTGPATGCTGRSWRTPAGRTTRPTATTGCTG